MSPNITPLIFAALGIIFLILSSRKTNPVQSKVWVRTGIIFLVVAFALFLININN